MKLVKKERVGGKVKREIEVKLDQLYQAYLEKKRKKKAMAVKSWKKQKPRVDSYQIKEKQDFGYLVK